MVGTSNKPRRPGRQGRLEYPRDDQGPAIRVCVLIRLCAVVAICPTGVDCVDSEVKYSAQVRRLFTALKQGDAVIGIESPCYKSMSKGLSTTT